MENKDDIIKTCNRITQELLLANLEILNKGIQDILDHNKSNVLDSTKYSYKQYFTVMQHIQNFTHNKYFIWNLIFTNNVVNLTA